MTMIRIITISREYGSGGEALARILAQRLAWRLVDDALVTEIARANRVNPELARHCDETLDPWFHRLVKGLWRGGYEGGVTRVDTDVFDADTMAKLWNRLILESADIGECVIVGRGGQCLLQQRTDAFHVGVYAPMKERVRRIRQYEPNQKDPEAAAQDMDSLRAAYIRRHFGQDWTNRHLYQLMVCSSIGLENAATSIIYAAGLKPRELS